MIAKKIQKAMVSSGCTVFDCSLVVETAELKENERLRTAFNHHEIPVGITRIGF